MRARLRPLALVLALSAALPACVAHDGAWQTGQAAPVQPAEASVSLVVVGNAGAPTKWAQEVGAELDARLSAERDQGREPIVLWLGGLSLPRHPARRGASCPDIEIRDRPGASVIAAAVAAHVARGGASYATPGRSDWRCGQTDALMQDSATDGPNPWAMPDHNYVVRIDPDGRSKVASHCGQGRCTIDADGLALVDLVVVDAVPWIAPPTDDADRERKDAAVRQLDALLAAVRADAHGPPRILVGAVPVEAAGWEGMGGGGTDAAFHYLPPSLKEAVRDGVFAGSIGALDRSQYATADITDAVKRSSRAWLSAPVFQIVSGSASLPDSRFAAGYRRVRYYRANAYHPAAYSDYPGFAVVYVAPESVGAVLYAHRRRWEHATVIAPLSPPKNAIESPSPILPPCQNCRRIPAPQR